MRDFVLAKVTVLALVLFALILSGYGASSQTESDRNSQTPNSKNANNLRPGLRPVVMKKLQTLAPTNQRKSLRPALINPCKIR